MAKAFAQRRGGRPHGSYDAVLADDAVDAVYIALPNHLHAEWTIRAAEAGKHVLCEKPFALNAVQAQHAFDACAPHGVFCMEAFMYRCHPQTQMLQQLLNDGAIGAVRCGSSTPTSATPRRRPGSAMSPRGEAAAARPTSFPTPVSTTGRPQP